MAEKNLIDEIKAAEDQAAASVREAKAAAVRRLNQAQTEAENTVKEARQSAARQFRESIQAAEESAEGRAKAIVKRPGGGGQDLPCGAQGEGRGRGLVDNGRGDG